MVSEFSRVVDYRSYRLEKRNGILTKGQSLGMIDFKRQFDGLYPTMRPYEGKPALLLLSFLTQIKDSFDMIGEC